MTSHDITFDVPQEREQLLLRFYDELRNLARGRMARLAPGQTLTPTGLVHEAYMRMNEKTSVRFESRRHFFFAASRAMRDTLVENARRKASLKRGGDCRRIELGSVQIPLPGPSEEMLALDRALEKLEREKPHPARVVQLRYFAGLTVAEVAEVTECSQATVKRRWTYARAWLRRELSRSLPTVPS